MNTRTILTALTALVLISGCSLPQKTPEVPSLALTLQALPTPTLSLSLPTQGFNTPAAPAPTLPIATFAPTTASGSTQPAATARGVATQPSSEAFCADAQVTALIDSLKTALLTSNGPSLASLVSPVHGTDFRLYRYGRFVTYDQQHARFLFESTFEVNWGDSFGSGLPTVGSWHDVILPALLKLFNTSYTLSCNKLQVGGTTYVAAWDYPGVNYYSVHFPGTAENGNMDWRTWAVGTEYVGGRPYLYALMQFEWEP